MINQRSFGSNAQGQAVTLYTLENSKGMKAEVTDFGAILVNLFVPDKNGKIDDVVLGYDDVTGYIKNPSFFGATVGPNANRIANAKFSIDGTEYQLDINDGVNNLHSHIQKGYHKQMFAVTLDEAANAVTFTIEDTDGNLGFPGNKTLAVTYSVTEANELVIKYHGTSDKKTVINPTNHTYFNLDGHDCGKSIEDHTLMLKAACYTPVVSGAIPTGELAPVSGTPMDFTAPKVVGKEIGADFKQLKLTLGYDHNWVIDGWDGTLREMATVEGPVSGRKMVVSTDLPGVQFYAGNCITPEPGKKGTFYNKRSGLCLETQFYPDSINQPSFPSCVFGAGKDYDSVTIYRFE